MRRIFLAPLMLVVALSLAGCTDDPEVKEQTVQKVFTIEPGDWLEYKLFVEEDGSFEYAWESDLRVVYDFHGDRGDGSSFFQTHKKGTAAADSGDFVAPFKGNHGWYYENSGSQTVNIRLTVTGTFDEVGVI